MPKYFFHLATPGKLIIDEEGRELPELDAAREEAQDLAREIIADARRENGDVDGFAFNVTDDSGLQVIVFDFKNLLNGRAG